MHEEEEIEVDIVEGTKANVVVDHMVVTKQEKTTIHQVEDEDTEAEAEAYINKEINFRYNATITTSMIIIADFAEFTAISTALQIFIEVSWEGNECLVIESDSKVVLHWISEPLNRPWRWWNDLMVIDALVKKIGKVLFSHVSRQCNTMADALAKEGVYRQKLFKAWW
ncbi:hypothetical protein GQ457_15G001740 [Hibiscus cannabinus]